MPYTDEEIYQLDKLDDKSFADGHAPPYNAMCLTCGKDWVRHSNYWCSRHTTRWRHADYPTPVILADRITCQGCELQVGDIVHAQRGRGTGGAWDFDAYPPRVVTELRQNYDNRHYAVKRTLRDDPEDTGTLVTVYRDPGARFIGGNYEFLVERPDRRSSVCNAILKSLDRDGVVIEGNATIRSSMRSDGRRVLHIDLSE